MELVAVVVALGVKSLMVQSPPQFLVLPFGAGSAMPLGTRRLIARRDSPPVAPPAAVVVVERRTSPKLWEL